MSDTATPRNSAAAPVYDVDMYSDAVIREPWVHDRAIRDLGPLVWLPQNRLYAIGRHEDVRAALSAHDVLISGRGVAANDTANGMANANLLASDPPLHDELRRIVARPVRPDSLNAIKDRIMASAELLIDRLLVCDHFDGMTDLAHVLPVSIVSELVGLPEAGRENMLRWAGATFDMLGGDNARMQAALPVVRQMRTYCETQATPDKVRAGGWVAMLYDAARQGLIETEKVPVLMRDYLGPALDTTIFATGHLLYRLGTDPAQWDLLRARPDLIGNAINEAVRLDSPIRGFTRLAAQDYSVGGLTVPAGSRVLILFASANRDERKWPDSDRFDIERNVLGHVGFGHGIHACVGMQLARLEMRSILTAMIARVARIEVGQPDITMNNVLRGFGRLPMRLIAA